MVEKNTSHQKPQELSDKLQGHDRRISEPTDADTKMRWETDPNGKRVGHIDVGGGAHGGGYSVIVGEDRVDYGCNH